MFVDTSVEDHEQLLADLLAQGDGERHVEVHMLDGQRDGIEQISAVLAGYQDVDAVHVVSHGTDAAVQLGNTWFGLNNLDTYTGALTGWKSALASDADVLFYGCNLAASAQGQALLEAISALTDADVAASVDYTGHTALGGDWVLEYASGSIESTVAFSQHTQQEWSGLLATFTVTNTNNAGPGSLRQAIIDANSAPGADTIILPAGTYVLSGDLDITDDVTITGAGATTTILDGGGNDRVFNVSSGTVDMSGLTIRNGDAGGSAGGGMRIGSGGNVTLTNVIVSGNVAGDGGGIHNSGTLVLTDVEISGNSGPSGWGGGLYNNAATAQLERVTFSGNVAGKDGGGIYNFGVGARLELTNVTISGNTATSDGGGIYTSRPVNIITNSTIALNTASSGGGIYVQGAQGQAVLKNTILDNNTGGNTNKALTSLGNNIDSDGTAGLAGPGDQVIDPMLGPLQDNGGPTETHALLAGSPAINAGTNVGAPAVDQRGGARDATTDIGAFEFGGVTNTASVWLTTNGHVTGGGQPGIDTWREGDLVQIADPNLAFDPGSTNGTFSVAASMNTFISDKNVSAVHYVGADMQVGASNFQLFAGDLLLASKDASSFGGLAVSKEDVVVFHPDTPGDYSAGTFTMLLKNPVGAEIRGISLIEQNTTVGDANLQAGDFLFIRSGGAEDSSVWLFETTDVGATSTSGTASVLLEGSDAGININKQIHGVDLVETTTTIGGQTLNAGTILLSINAADNVGNNSLAVTEHDIFALDVTTTTLVSGVGNGAAAASLFFDGGDVAFDSGSEELDGFTLTGVNNSAPTATNLSAAESYTEDTPLNLTAIVVSDVDSATVTVTLTLSDPGAGSLSTGTSGAVTSTYNGGTGVWTASGALADVNTLLAGVTYTPRVALQ